VVLFRSANNFKVDKLEKSYAMLGTALGASFSVSGLLIDMQVRAWRGMDAGVTAPSAPR